MIQKVVIMVLDSLGIGGAPDSAAFGDKDTDTLAGILATMGRPLEIPNLLSLGLGSIDGVSGFSADAKETLPRGAYGRFRERSKGKDTITGHWEIAGIVTETPFLTFEKFPDEFMRAFEEAIGRETLGNYAASGTEIIKELGPEHKATGKPIIYTSQDSVFQIAANTAVIPLEELYRICEIAREMLVGDLQVARVIARPFVEEDGVYTRTADRRDYAVSPPEVTLLDNVSAEGLTVFAIGKIEDIFNGSGVTRSIHTKSNDDGVDQTIKALREDFRGLIFTNLVDFDAKYGHRRNGPGYGEALEAFDRRLPEIWEALGEDDVLILCADHGNDPRHTGWDHTREDVPCLVCGKGIAHDVNLGLRTSFADMGATAADLLGAAPTPDGESFKEAILK